ncbi:MAG: phytoene/squalene synthase family protein [Pseudomonadota bacterium]|nr:phytoene/squalene synthase family protein [Pseudomonadota bacterium]
MNRDALVAGAGAAIQSGSKSFRAASRLFDRATRERAWLLYCWCRHCDDVCDGQVMGYAGGSRGSIAELRRKTDAAIRNEKSDELPFEGLRALLHERPIPRRYLDEHLEGFALDEQGWTPATEEDLERYCYHVAGTVGCMMAIVMGVAPDDEQTLERAADLGIAFQLSNIARDIREDLGTGRCYLPQDWLDELGVERHKLFAIAHRSALLEMVERLLASVALYEASARRGVNRLPFRSRLAVLSALRIYGAIGRRVRDLGAEAWDRRVSVSKMQKLAYLAPSFAEAVTLRRPR